MAQNLPQEILDLVLGEFEIDGRAGKRAIAKCGLVCKSWFPASRYRLFGDVDLNDHTIKPFLNVVDHSLVAVPSCIRSLGLSFSEREDTLGLDASLRRIGSLPLVTTLRITMKESVLVLNSALLAETFPGISSLVFRNVPIELGSIPHAVSTFPLLKSLELDWVQLSYDTLLPSYQFPPQWNSLTLDLLADESSQPFFKALLSLNPPPVISSLSVREMEPTERSAFGRYLSHIGNALHYLRLELGASKHFKTKDPLGLRACTGLRRLDIVFHDSSDIAIVVHQALSCLRSRTLTSVNVFDKTGLNSREFVTRRWQQVDEKLAEEQFTGLKMFCVESKSQYLVSGLAESMPLSEARGLLRAVGA